jgi:hypothetical protein
MSAILDPSPLPISKFRNSTVSRLKCGARYWIRWRFVISPGGHRDCWNYRLGSVQTGQLPLLLTCVSMWWSFLTNWEAFTFELCWSAKVAASWPHPKASMLTLACVWNSIDSGGLRERSNHRFIRYAIIYLFKIARTQSYLKRWLIHSSSELITIRNYNHLSVSLI